MTTSVAMCTYNGAQFIEEQLRSILDQTIPVGEVVVCDDCSTDETISIIEKIAKETTIPIHIYVNETNLGCVRNFEKAIHLCQGDIIFLSDQDDVWMSNKVEAITQWFDQHPTMNVVFGDAILVDNMGIPIMKSQVQNAPPPHKKGEDEPVMLWEDIGFTRLSKEQFKMGLSLELWIVQNRATGATMAFRNEFAENIQIVYPKYYHDFALSFNGILVDALGFIDKPLIYYRQHTEQATGCSLKFPIPQGWDDARVINKYELDFSAFKIDKKTKDRIDFVQQRYFIQYSVIRMAHWKNWPKYKYLYGKNGLYMFTYDICKSIKYTIKHILKKK